MEIATFSTLIPYGSVLKSRKPLLVSGIPFATVAAVSVLKDLTMKE